MLRLNPLEAKTISAAGYDRDEQFLYIQHKNGELNVYKNVPFEVYQGLLQAKNRDRFERKEIMGFYVQQVKTTLPA